jgi:hypothetical protein
MPSGYASSSGYDMLAYLSSNGERLEGERGVQNKKSTVKAENMTLSLEGPYLVGSVHRVCHGPRK